MQSEITLTIKETGMQIAFPSTEQNPTGVDYVRVLDSEGNEVVYYDSEEWRSDPQGAIGALLGSLMSEGF